MIRKVLLSSSILLLSFSIFAQNSLELAKEYIETHLEDWQLEASDIAEMRVSNQYTSEHNGVTHIYFTQQYKGLDINNAVLNINILKNGEVVFAPSRFIPNLQAQVPSAQPYISAEDALLSAAIHLGLKDLTIPTSKEVLNKHTYIYDGATLAQRPIKVQLKYIATEKNIKLVWAIDIDVHDSPDYWTIKVDAEDGKILAQDNYTVYCNHAHHAAGNCKEEVPQFLPSLLNNTDGASYNVFALPAESPIHGTRSLVVNPADSTASPYGWHDTDGMPGAEYTITRGNNVHAYPDTTNSNESTGIEPDGGEELIFDYPYQEGIEPDSFLDFATTQLFYMNNVMHDFTYAYGFTEAAGNFQENNYNRGGEGSDQVIANAQDGGGSNNANFGTPPDGGSGFMQMYTWSRSGLLTVTAPLSLAGTYETRTAGFGPDIISENLFIAAEVEIANDASSAPTLACNELQNDLTGKIALIDRGECFFSTKVYHAELAGAVAVIICNYEGGSFSGMSAGTEDPISIPSVMMRYNDCLRIRDFVGQQLSAEISVPDDEGPTALDGTLDNGIIAHEYGHGISGRLTGGADNSECLFNNDQMGEGWSDFFSLVTTVHPDDEGSKKRGIGTYVQQQEIDGSGIRRYPYSNDMNVNPQTYLDVVGTGVHATGEVWAVTLWDLYWAMVDEYGWDEDLYHGTGGNNMAIQLVMDGMKFQPCSPGFIDGRDAILAADKALYDGANQCIIWNVFARRGLGWGATQGNNNNINDGFEDFEPMPTCIQELKIVKVVTDEIKAGDDINVTLTLTNDKATTATDLMITDILPEGTSFTELLTEELNAEVSNNIVAIGIEELAAGESMEISYTLSTSPDLYSTSYFRDDMESGGDNWDITPIGSPLNTENADIWRLDPVRGLSSSAAWFVPSTGNDNDQGLQLFDPIVVAGEQAVLRFVHRYQTEWGNDGGIVQISADGGLNWDNVDQKLFKNPYPSRLTYGAFAIPNLGGFTGDDLSFKSSYIDLSDYVGQEVFVRFRFGTDEEPEGSTGTGFGWAVDNIEFMDMFNYNSEVCIVSAEGDMACASAAAKGTIVDAEEVTATTDIAEQHLEASIYPNPAGEYINIDINSIEHTDLTICIFTMDGQKVLHKNDRLQQGQNHLVVQANGLSEGFYVVELRSRNHTTFQKVVIAQ